MSLSTDAVDELAFDAPTGKRAVYEALTFSVGAGYVEVTNESHDDPDAHCYRVDVVDGEPVRCGCPAAQYHCGPDEACKHRVAVALAPAVCEAASVEGDR
jgi:hypothetical protein